MGRKRKKKRIRLIEKKLGRERALGQAFSSERLIEIDPRLRSKIRLSVSIHEILHVVFPEMSESRIDKAAPTIADTLWRDGFRRTYK